MPAINHHANIQVARSEAAGVTIFVSQSASVDLPNAEITTILTDGNLTVDFDEGGSWRVPGGELEGLIQALQDARTTWRRLCAQDF